MQAISKDMLAIQVSTVASESSFSTSKRVIDPYRSSMTPETIDALIYFQNWLKSDSMMGLGYIPAIEEVEFFEAVEKEIQDEIKAEVNMIASNEEDTEPNPIPIKIGRISSTSDASKVFKCTKISKATTGRKDSKKKV